MKKPRRGRPPGAVTGSLVYLLRSLERAPAVIVPTLSIDRTMKTIGAHFHRSPHLRGIKYHQRAVYCIAPGLTSRLFHGVLVERELGRRRAKR